jgi:hypothetical protein
MIMGCKGSKRCLQVYLSERREILEEEIRKKWGKVQSIEWLGPKMVEGEWDWKELAGNSFWKALCIGPQRTRDFWPARGPHWDAVAKLTLTSGSNHYILFEAKANVSELKSYLRAGDKCGQRTKIEQSLRTYSHNVRGYYQTCNRLAHLNYIRKEFPAVKVSLCYLLFTNDNSHIPTRREEWLYALGIEHDKFQYSFQDAQALFNYIFLDCSAFI